MGDFALTATGRRQVKEGDSWIEFDVVGTTYDTDGSTCDFSDYFDEEVRDVQLVLEPTNGTRPIFVPGTDDDPATAVFLMMTVSGDPGAIAQVANTTDISGAGYQFRIRANGY